MKQIISFLLFAFTGVIQTYAAKIPSDLLDSPVGIVLYEFSVDENANEHLEFYKEQLIDDGLNVVAVHNVSDRYDAKIANADMKAKNVKYVYRIMSKFFKMQTTYHLHVFPYNELKDEEFRKAEKSAFIYEGATSIESLHKKYYKNIEKYSKKNTLSNTKTYDETLIDTVMILPEDKDLITKIIDKRTVLHELESFNRQGLPKDIRSCKIAFVKFDNMDFPNQYRLCNPFVAPKLKKLDIDVKVFDTYDDYLKNKDKFDYRIIFSKKNLAFKSTKHIYNEYNTPWAKKGWTTKSQQTDKVLVSLLLRDEKNGDLYQCTELEWISSVVGKFKKALKDS
ncbi:MULTISPECIES: hypothetical protein [unclassified Carboxylicivirga]|uniref:hypothetical protein n=1 Tax=Carboxylicivirga TaxID=1628153 RepID=UPI003D33DEED